MGHLLHHFRFVRLDLVLNAINEKTKIILQNDGRLLKKSFFGLIINNELTRDKIII